MHIILGGLHFCSACKLYEPFDVVLGETTSWTFKGLLGAVIHLKWLTEEVDLPTKENIFAELAFEAHSVEPGWSESKKVNL